MTMRVLRLLTGGLVGLGLIAFRVGASGPVWAVEPGRAAKPATPEQVFRASCLECHDSDGRGEAGREQFPSIPDFTDRGWQASRPDAELSRSILEGRGKSMPRMKSKLGSVEVGRMVAFVRAFAGGRQFVAEEPEGPPAVAAAGPATTAHVGSGLREGERLFQRYCMRCHGVDGRGTEMRESLVSLPDFTGRAWQAGRNDSQLLVSVLGGRGTGMPPFRSKLGRDQVRAVVAYVRAFAPSATGTSGTTADDFAARFEELEREIESLARQFHALSTPPPHP
jgi:mono/diheme cytochrome c family protein